MAKSTKGSSGANKWFTTPPDDAPGRESFNADAAKRQEAIRRDRILQSAAPSTRELTYEQMLEKYGHVDGWQETLRSQGFDVRKRSDFNRLAESEEIQQKRELWRKEEEELAPIQARSEAARFLAEQRGEADKEFQSRIESMVADLERVGQGPRDGSDPASAFKDASNVADLSQRMFLAEGEDAEEMRQQAAWVLYNFRDQLEPHLDEGWYAKNEEDIKKLSGNEDPSWWRSGLNEAGGVLGRGLGLLGELGEASASSLAGTFAAMKYDDVTWRDALKHVSKEALDAVGAFEPTAWLPTLTGINEGRGVMRTLFNNDGNYMQLEDGRTLALDRDENGTLNLREVMLKDPDWHSGDWVSFDGSLAEAVDRAVAHVGPQAALENLTGVEINPMQTFFDEDNPNTLGMQGFMNADRRFDAMGVLDTIGLAVIDPTTYIGVGTATRGRLLVQAARRSNNPIARRAATRMSDDMLRMGQLSNIEQAALRAANRQNILDDLARYTPEQINRIAAREGLTSPQLLTKWRGLTKDADGMLNALVDTRLNRVQRMMDNGASPAFRIAGKRIVPLKRVYQLMGLRDKGRWIQRSRVFNAMEDIDEVMEFFTMADDFENITPELRDKIRRSGGFFDTLENDPYTALADVYNTATEIDVAYDQARRIADTVGIDTSEWDDIWRQVVDSKGLAGKYQADTLFDQAEFIEGDDFARGNAGKGRVIGDEDKYQVGGRWAHPRERERLIDEGWEIDDNGFMSRKIDDTRYAGRNLGEPEQLSFGMIDDSFRAIDDLPTPKAMSEEALARVKANMDIYNNPEQWVREVQRRSLLGAARAASRGLDTPFPAWLGKRIAKFSDAFSPRAGIRQGDNLGRAIADEADDKYAMSQAFANLFEDDLIRLGWDPKVGKSDLIEQAMKKENEIVSALDIPGDTVDEVITRVLASGEGEELIPALTKLTEAGATNTSRMISTLDSIRDGVFKLNVAGEADVDALLRHHGYMPRQNTKAAQEAFDLALDQNDTARLKAFEKLGLAEKPEGKFVPAPTDSTLMQQGHLKGRTFKPEVEDLFELNEEARKVWAEAGLGDMDFKLYEDDAVTAWALRSREAHEGAALMSMYQGLSELEDTAGRKLVYIARQGADDTETAANRAAVALRMKGDVPGQRFREVTLPNGGTAFVNGTIYDDMVNTNRLLLREKTQGQAAKFMEEWNTTWGRYATSPLIGFGFHARNATGNVYNMILAGATNPRIFAQAAETQTLLDSVRDVMRSTGANWNDAMKAVDMSDFQRQVITAARTHNIYNQGGRLADLTAATRGDSLGLTQKPGIAGTSQRFSDNALTRSGQAFGNTVENNAKLALLIDGMQNGLDPQAAAHRVRTYLFDYTDLTAFESEKMRMLNRFYTFTRKNTALQIHALSTQPGRVVNANRVINEWVNFWMGGEEEGEPPSSGYLGEGRFLPPWAQNVMSVYGGGRAAGVETPFTAADDTLAVLDTIAQMPPTMVRLANATDEDREAAYEEFQSQWRDTLALTSGGPVEAVKTVSEYLTGRDSFTGAKLSNKDREWYHIVTRMTDIAAPIGSKVTRFGENQEWWGDKGEVSDDAAWLNNFLGIQALDMDDPEDKQRAVDNMLANTGWNLRRAVDGWEEATGEELHTIKELEELGRIDFRNRTVDFFLQSAMDPEFDWDNLSDEVQQQLTSGMNKQFMEVYFGVVPPTAEKGTPERLAQDQAALRNMQQMLDYAEAMGIEVTPQMREEYAILTTDGMTISGLKDLGIEPVYLENKFNRGPAGESTTTARTAAAIEVLEDLYGWDLSEARPLLTSHEREVMQMQAEGYTRQEIQEYLFENMSRKEQVYFFGTDALEMFKYDRFTPEDVEKMQRRSWEAGGMWNVMNAVYFGDSGAPGDYEQFLAHMLMTNKEERALGYEPIKTPSARDARTDAEKQEDSQNKWWAVQSGQDYLSTLGNRD